MVRWRESINMIININQPMTVWSILMATIKKSLDNNNSNRTERSSFFSERCGNGVITYFKSVSASDLDTKCYRGAVEVWIFFSLSSDSCANSIRCWCAGVCWCLCPNMSALRRRCGPAVKALDTGWRYCGSDSRFDQRPSPPPPPVFACGGFSV